jgi:S-adenosylmethionine hydrolase
MALRYDTVSFLSDYGRVDEFVGVVHSVIRAIAPDVGVIDLTHDIAPYDTRGAGLALARSAQYLCPGVVLAIVDPGVGGDRRAIAVEVGDGASVLVGPDNGVLAPAVAMCGGATAAVELTNLDYQLPAPGPTFAGRDIFAPAAAHLCAGVSLHELGPAIEPVTLLPGVLPVSRDEDGTLVGEVLWIDRYGNAQLNIDPSDIATWGDRIGLRFNGETRTAKVVTTFGDIGPGDIGLVTDSYGLLSVVLDRRAAATDLGLGPAIEVQLLAFGDDDELEPTGVTTPVTLGSRPNHEEA